MDTSKTLGKELSWAEAAQIVMKQCGPMSDMEILNSIREKRLKDIHESGPSALACLNLSLHFNSSGSESLFYKVPGQSCVYGLRGDLNTSSKTEKLPETLDDFNSEVCVMNETESSMFQDIAGECQDIAFIQTENDFECDVVLTSTSNGYGTPTDQDELELIDVEYDDTTTCSSDTRSDMCYGSTATSTTSETASSSVISFCGDNSVVSTNGDPTSKDKPSVVKKPLSSKARAIKKNPMLSHYIKRRRRKKKTKGKTITGNVKKVSTNNTKVMDSKKTESAKLNLSRIAGISPLTKTPSLQEILAEIPGFSCQPKRKYKRSHAAQLEQSRTRGCVDLQTPNSVLVNTNLKTLINRDTFFTLPVHYRIRLLKLLPSCDQISKRNEAGISTAALTNEFFNQARSEWIARLAEGEFTSENQQRMRQEQEKMHAKMDPWKLAHFEAFWGDKFEDDVDSNVVFDNDSNLMVDNESVCSQVSGLSSNFEVEVCTLQEALCFEGILSQKGARHQSDKDESLDGQKSEPDLSKGIPWNMAKESDNCFSKTNSYSLKQDCVLEYCCNDLNLQNQEYFTVSESELSCGLEIDDLTNSISTSLRIEPLRKAVIKSDTVRSSNFAPPRVASMHTNDSKLNKIPKVKLDRLDISSLEDSRKVTADASMKRCSKSEISTTPYKRAYKVTSSQSLQNQTPVLITNVISKSLMEAHGRESKIPRIGGSQDRLLTTDVRTLPKTTTAFTQDTIRSHCEINNQIDPIKSKLSVTQSIPNPSHAQIEKSVTQTMYATSVERMPTNISTNIYNNDQQRESNPLATSSQSQNQTRPFELVISPQMSSCSSICTTSSSIVAQSGSGTQVKVNPFKIIIASPSTHQQSVNLGQPAVSNQILPAMSPQSTIATPTPTTGISSGVSTPVPSVQMMPPPGAQVFPTPNQVCYTVNPKNCQAAGEQSPSKLSSAPQPQRSQTDKYISCVVDDDTNEVTCIRNQVTCIFNELFSADEFGHIDIALKFRVSCLFSYYNVNQLHYNYMEILL